VLDFALVDDALEVEPDVLLALLESDDESVPELEPEDDVGLLLLPLPIDVFDDDDDDGVLDDPLDMFDDWFELWFFSVSFIVVISLFLLKIKFVACRTQLRQRGIKCGFCYVWDIAKTLVAILFIDVTERFSYTNLALLGYFDIVV
jgi:hypothetical protein